MNNEKTENCLRAGMALITLVVMSAAIVADAGASASPPWSQGATTTFEQWSFSEWNYGPVAPDSGWNNAFGTPELVVSTSSNWNSSVGQHNGVWTLNGEMDFIIPNYPVAQPEKDIWVEVLWKGAGLSNFIPDKPLLGIECDYDSVVISQQATLLDDGWTDTLFKLNVYPNPSSEWLVLKGDIMVDSVTINTICIPEPATFSLLVGGALMAIRRKTKGLK